MIRSPFQEVAVAVDNLKFIKKELDIAAATVPMKETQQQLDVIKEVSDSERYWHISRTTLFENLRDRSSGRLFQGFARVQHSLTTLHGPSDQNK